MRLLDGLRYHLNVNLVGAGVLRYQRLQDQRRVRRPAKPGPFGPPLQIGPRLKELISTHYLKGRYANPYRKVAWVTSGAPVEYLSALGFLLIYPENHGAVCGIRRDAEGLSKIAESEGYSNDLCSYARTDIGSALSGKTPVGRLPRPDLLVCCTNICQTVLYWYRVLARTFGVPLVVIDTPFVYDAQTDHSVEYIRRQIEAAIEQAERVAGRSVKMAELISNTERSREACALWGQVLQCATAKPTPFSAFDAFIHLAPIVEMRGEQFTVEYYRALLAELQQRQRDKVGAIREERHRLLWDNLPIWHRMRWLSERLAERGATLVASTYTNAWAELVELYDPQRPIESAARVYAHAILNRSTGHKLKTIKNLAKEYGATGVMMHSDRSCKPYSIGQIDQRQSLVDANLPALLIEADHNDPRAFSEQQVATRIDAFIELLEQGG